MKRILFFVEGQTEAIFLETFLSEFLKDKPISILKVERLRRHTLLKIILKENKLSASYDYEFAIFQSDGNTESLVSDIRELGQKFLNVGYEKIYGICDFYDGQNNINDISFIKANVNNRNNIDLVNDDPETNPAYKKPAKLINSIYRLAGKTYKKRKDDCYKIANILDYDYLYASDRTKIKAFYDFIDDLDKLIA